MKNYFNYAQEENRKQGAWDFMGAFAVKVDKSNLLYKLLSFFVFSLIFAFLMHWFFALISAYALANFVVYLKNLYKIYRLISPHKIPWFGSLKEQFLKTGIIPEMSEVERQASIDFIDRKISAASVKIDKYNFFFISSKQADETLLATVLFDELLNLVNMRLERESTS